MASQPSEAVLFEFSQTMSSTIAARRLQQRREKRASTYLNGRPISRIPVAVTPKVPPNRRPSLYDLRPTSAGGLRRSVSCMKKLLPLRLASPEPEIYTTPCTEVHNSFGLVYHQKQDSTASTVVPWMQITQEVPLLGDLHPNMYRETPIYSEPKSPAVARAYFSEEDICLNCEPPGSPCEELCIVDSYLTEDSDSYVSADHFADCAESFDDRSATESEVTSNTEYSSWESSRYSELSIKCRGEKYGKGEAVWYKNPVSSVSPFAPTLEEDELLSNQADQDSHNIGSGDSRCSSATNTTQIFNASATPLAPARPQMVNVTSPSLPPIYTSEESSLSFEKPRPSTPPGWASRKMSTLESPPFTPKQQSIPEASLGSPASSFKQKSDAAMHTPPRSPMKSLGGIGSLAAPFQSELNYTRSVPRHRFDVNDIAEEVLALPLIEAICDAIDGSPRDLQLDTFCIREIRRQNRRARMEMVSPQPPSLASLDPEAFSDFHTSRPIRGRKSLFSLAPLKNVVTNKSKYRDTVLTGVPRFPSAPSTPPVPISMSHTSADLQALRNIFPDSDDWWRGVLYAHLVAYNYIRDVRQAHQPAAMRQLLKPKATRTLGLPEEASAEETSFELLWEASGFDESFDAIQDGLASCINRIISCMAGDYEGMRDHLDGLSGGRINYAFVRTLAEVVRSCERHDAKEAERAEPPMPTMPASQLWQGLY